MPENNRSARVMEQRAKNYDRFSCLIDKGGNQLIRVGALREGVSMAELIRRAILAYIGLSGIPSGADLEALKAATTTDQAREAIKNLQMNEIHKHLIDEMDQDPVHPDQFDVISYLLWFDKLEASEYIQAIKNVAYSFGKSFETENTGNEYEPVVISRRDVERLRRLLANIEPDAPDEEENPQDIDQDP